MDLQLPTPFLTVRSMANHTVVIRRDAIKDVHLSSEAFDTFGPEHGDYKRFGHIMIPDPREWSNIEAMVYGVGIEDFGISGNSG